MNIRENEISGEASQLAFLHYFLYIGVDTKHIAKVLLSKVLL